MGRFIFITIMLILLLVGFIIVQTNNLDLSEGEGKKEFVLSYGKWLYKAIINIKNIVGYSINLEWKVNETNSTG